ncbi:unnamed protein product [Fusarium fujikuroi]|nr:hypothetical protein CEK25_006873 [Fusarium fujikuroi]VTT71147.1 unnamed protein product [Fusarium fujikuroi]VZI03896.1 unnamed protein product [Fusarium fujikuroi]
MNSDIAFNCSVWHLNGGDELTIRSTLLEHVGSLMSQKSPGYTAPPTIITSKYSYPVKIMHSLLVLVSLLSLTTASHVSRSAPDTDGEYSWDCGHMAPFSVSDCNELLDWFKTISKTGWFGIGKANGLAKYWGSCQLYIQPGPLGYFALEIQQDEFVGVVRQGPAPSDTMWFVLTFMSHLSLTSANFLRNDMLGWNPSYNSSTYYWLCGTNTTAARSDCEYALDKAIHSPLLTEIGKNTTMWAWFNSCKVTVCTNENYDTVNGPIQMDEFRDVVNWGFGSLCGLGMQRTWLTPHNNTWYAYVTETAWELDNRL